MWFKKSIQLLQLLSDLFSHIRHTANGLKMYLSFILVLYAAHPNIVFDLENLPYCHITQADGSAVHPCYSYIILQMHTSDVSDNANTLKQPV